MAPERIVSLVPSLTETLFALGVGGRVVGRTRYCTQPPRTVGKIAKVGGTKKIDVERVLELDPDLVVAVKEENSREDVEALAGLPVFLGAPETVEGAVRMLRDLAARVEAPRSSYCPTSPTRSRPKTCPSSTRWTRTPPGKIGYISWTASS